MIERLISWSLRNRAVVLVLTALAVVWGLWSMKRVPLDAIPDLSDTQVIVYTEWGMNSPDLVEDQVTYPIVSTLLAAPRVKNVRGYSFFGTSFVYAIFDDGTDIYWARTRILEYLDRIQAKLPKGATATLGPDATGLGWGFQYALVDRTGKHDLAEMRALQDWTLRYALESVEGVAEVATVGGFEKEYQVVVDPNRLAAYNVTLDHFRMALSMSNNDVGGRVLEYRGREFMVRGRGYLKSVEDIQKTVLMATAGGTPITIGDVAHVTLAPAFRRGAADFNGEGEAVGGIVVVRFGENVLTVIDRVKEKIDNELKLALPEGVELVTVYDRSDLIRAAIGNLKHDLTMEMIVLAAFLTLFLLHIRSTLTPLITLPVAVVLSFIPMQLMHVTSNIMSLGGIALAIGELGDAALVMLENAYRQLSEGGEEAQKNRLKTIERACQQVGRGLFFSLLIMVVSFLPVFMLEAQEGRLFRPLAWTKSLSILGASLLSVTLVPVLLSFFLGGKLKPDAENPVSKACIAVYRPVLRWVMANPWKTLLANFLVIPLTIPVLGFMGREFMPPLREGTLLYMPTTLPGVSLTEARRMMQVQDEILKSFPEVDTVFGKVGRANTATDPAPIMMWETTITLRPEKEWRPGMNYKKLIEELDKAMKFPGITNAWTMPIKARIDMLTTGIRTPVGIKVFGDNLKEVERVATDIERVVAAVPGTRSAYAERAASGAYLDITVNRDECARHGISVGDVEMVIETALGGMPVTTMIQGRERYGVTLRYAPDFRDSPERIAAILVPSSHGTRLTLGQVADIRTTTGPDSIKDEDGKITSWVFVDVKDVSLGEYVDGAKAAVDKAIADGTVKMPKGYYLSWSGQYEFQVRAKKRITLILPLVAITILFFLYITFDSLLEAILVLLGVIYSLTGGVLLQWAFDFNWSVAVWVGYISLFGVAVSTGVVMVIYLHEALDAKIKEKGAALTAQDIKDAAFDGALLRLRPKLMTVGTTFFGLMPLLWATGIGSDVMKPIAAPIIGGMVTSTIHVLVVTPLLFVLVKEFLRKKGKLTVSTGAESAGGNTTEGSST